MTTIHLTDRDVMPDVEANRLEGTFIDVRHHDRVIRERCRVAKPDGDILGLYLPDVIAPDICRSVFAALRDLPLASSNRGPATGAPRLRRITRDGRQSNTAQCRAVPSGVLGFLDRSRGAPCRLSALTADHVAEFAALRPMLDRVSYLFATELPGRHAAQWNFIEGVSPDFIIHGTPFTTVTVNRSWRTAAHRDEGDLRAGFGVMVVLGEFEGGELIFPKFRTAFDARPGGLLLADVHELHGNGPLDVPPGHQRLSLVFYAREQMKACGSAADELARAQETTR
ncbi:MAG: hypothetical protein AB7H93_13310 [Vicinamibacterales bacterium]